MARGEMIALAPIAIAKVEKRRQASLVFSLMEKPRLREMAFADAATARTARAIAAWSSARSEPRCGSHRTRFRLHRISEPDVSRLNIAELTHAMPCRRTKRFVPVSASGNNDCKWTC
jgi:hypothetical protein